MNWIVFTDLDESLLDGETYSFDAAAPALAELARRGIPLVFVTSKTAAESRAIQKRMGIVAPMIVEGGGGIVTSEGTIALAAPYADVRRAFEQLKTRASVRGFGDMTVDEVAKLTQLPREAAVLAMQREFDEPFVCLQDESGMLRAAATVPFRLSKGGRFWHLHGDTDKGRAARRVAAMYPGARTIGLGDSEMDLPLLAAVDVPVIIPRRDGSVNQALAAGVPHARRAPAPGPRGWNEAVLAILGA